MLLVILNIFAGQDWILILLVVLLLFGGKKIPELMRGLGQGVREFNAAKANIKSEIEEGMKQPSPPVQVPPTQTQTTTTTTENK
jgi:sec-independent protein translocase protein TatA